MCLANALLLSGVMRLSRRHPVRRFVATMLTSSGPAYVGYGLIGYLFVILWVPAEVGPFSALLVLSPLFVARWAFVQYGEENSAHERTLSALVAAVETKDPRTRGHSERVARLCDVIAGAMGLNHTDIASLRYAGMLHDVGILAVPSRVLRKVDGLSESELACIRQHPTQRRRDRAGHRVPQAGARRHRAPPRAIRRARVPRRAGGRQHPALRADRRRRRRVRVADHDERRPGRPARGRGAGRAGAAGRTQFDPVVVAALRRALAREPWPLRTLELSAVPGGGSGVRP